MRSNLTSTAKTLRKQMTKAEVLLWNKLRYKQLGAKFRRQQPIGNYIADIACLERQLIIEVDGGQHDSCEKDLIKDNWFLGQGFKVIRFWNNEVLDNIEGVLETIKGELPPSPTPPLKGGVNRLKVEG